MIKTSLELELREAAPGKDQSPFPKTPNLSTLGGDVLEARPTHPLDSCGGTDQPTRAPLHPAGKREVMALGRKHLKIKALPHPMQQSPLSTGTLLEPGAGGTAVWAQGLGQFPLELPRRQN